MTKLPSILWVVLVLGMPQMSPASNCNTSLTVAHSCSISPQDQIGVNTLSTGNLNFALNLYKGLANNENLFISSLSISVALAMTAAGAGGNTLSQMKNVLNLNGFADENQINQAFSSVLKSICSNTNYTLSTANKMYLQNNFPLIQTYLNTLTNYYQASAEDVDFQTNADAVAQQINTWVEQQTNDNIKDLFAQGSLGASTILVLVNAIYFNGSWQIPFDPQQTVTDTFTLADGQTVSVPMMNIKNNFKYAHSITLQSKILQLNYGGGRLAMLAILPDQTNGLPQLRQQLNANTFTSLRQQLSEVKVTVKIPKFTLSFKKQLNDLLKNLGMSDLFSQSSANLTGISNPSGAKLYVSTVIHQAFVNVNEQGTTAAAATGTGISITAVMQNPPEFIANRPFLFAIFDGLTGLILFVGEVNNPNA